MVGDTPFSITESSWPGGVGERLLSAEERKKRDFRFGIVSQRMDRYGQKEL